CTAYHFATRSLADFENLLSVYLDAAFFPCLDRLDFHQEGCRVEIEAPETEREAPVRRGVVLSEMRGLMNEPEQQLQQAVNRCLFPSTAYRFNAGGDPWEIPALDYDTLVAYHRRHYHPGNSAFLSAGPVRPEWLQERVQDLALARFSRPEWFSVTPSESIVAPPLESPVHSTAHYPMMCAQERDSLGVSVALAWRLGETSDPMAAARARLLARCLLEQGDAPLRRALLEASGNRATLLASNGAQATRRRLVFQCGLHGCDPDASGEIESRVLTAVDRIVRDGLDESQVNGALAQMEREERERHDRRYPVPLNLLTRILPAALYGGDPAAALDVTPTLAALRAENRSRQDVAELVRRCLRDNPERASVTAIPDPAAARRLEADDRLRLVREYGPSGRRARERIIERTRALRHRQETHADESSLPRLNLDAVGPARKRPEFLALPAGGLPGLILGVSRMTSNSHTGVDDAGGSGLRVGHGAATAKFGEARPSTKIAGSASIWVSRGPTDGLVYARLAIDLSAVELDWLDDVGLLADILPESGHGRFGREETRARIVRVCDRVSVQPWLLARSAPGSGASGAAVPRAVLLMSARARACDAIDLLDVLTDARFGARFDEGVRAAAVNARARRRKDLSRNGHLHAERIAAACLDRWNAVAERWQGPSALASLVEAAEGDGENRPMEERLQRVHRTLAAASHQLHVVCDRDHFDIPESDAHRGEGAPGAAPAAMGAAAGPMVQSPGMARAASEVSNSDGAAHGDSTAGAWIMEGPVNYCAKVFPAVTANHPDAGPLSVLAGFLGGDMLQRTIRERGGAYGAGARYCNRTATVRMFSYRDPRLGETLGDFDRAIEALQRQPPDGRKLEEAILRAIREIDRPRAFQVAASERLLDELQGRGADGTKTLRESVLGTDPERLRDVADRYLCPKMGRIGVLAGSGRESDLDRLGVPWRRM
ncbi:MAG: hypothetical protein OXU81_01610, partial [Gammaproteobacteria bacterium]|nr:hypothetical protein [Gammaproteobacteria bacterium]